MHNFKNDGQMEISAFPRFFIIMLNYSILDHIYNSNNLNPCLLFRNSVWKKHILLLVHNQTMFLQNQWSVSFSFLLFYEFSQVKDHNLCNSDSVNPTILQNVKTISCQMRASLYSNEVLWWKANLFKSWEINKIVPKVFTFFSRLDKQGWLPSSTSTSTKRELGLALLSNSPTDS